MLRQEPQLKNRVEAEKIEDIEPLWDVYVVEDKTGSDETSFDGPFDLSYFKLQSGKYYTYNASSRSDDPLTKKNKGFSLEQKEKFPHLRNKFGGYKIGSARIGASSYYKLNCEDLPYFLYDHDMVKGWCHGQIVTILNDYDPF